MAVGKYGWPQVAPGSTTGERGISSLHHPKVGTLRFRSNPKEFNWSYTLNKRVDQTYGGRVIQLLGTKIDDFTFKADSGALKNDGGWPYTNRVARFLRNVMIEQRDGVPATFEYTTRGWRFNAFVTSVPFADAVEDVLREFEVSMKVQEDVSGLMSQNTLQAEMARLKNGIGFQRSKYNDPLAGNNLADVPNSERFELGIQGALDTLSQIVPGLDQDFFTNGLQGATNFASTLLGGG